MSEEPVEGDSELRRRAAWLLAMLVVVAILVVVVMTTLLHADKGGGGGNAIGPDPITPTSPVSQPAHSSSPTTGPSTSSSAPTGSRTTSTPAGPSTCPTSSPCALQGDPGNAVAAVNAYRAQHNLPAAAGSVTASAQNCSLTNGSGCSGGYAESQVASLAGPAAIAKISGLKNGMLDPALKKFEIGWALVPSSKTYYFTFIADN